MVLREAGASVATFRRVVEPIFLVARRRMNDVARTVDVVVIVAVVGGGLMSLRRQRDQDGKRNDGAPNRGEARLRVHDHPLAGRLR